MQNYQEDISFSYIMAVQNSDDYIQSTIDSILNQKYNNFELLIIDCASKDNTISVCNKYTQKYSNVKLIILKADEIYNFLRIGINAASGQYVVFINGYNIVINNMLCSLNFHIKKNNNVDCIIFNMYKSRAESETPISFNNILEDKTIKNKLFYNPDMPKLYYQFFMPNKFFWKIDSFCFRKDFINKYLVKDGKNIFFNEIISLVNCFINLDCVFITDEYYYIWYGGHDTISKISKGKFKWNDINMYAVKNYYSLNPQVNSIIESNIVNLIINIIIDEFYYTCCNDNNDLYFIYKCQALNFNYKNVRKTLSNLDWFSIKKVFKNMKYKNLNSFKRKILLFILKHRMYFFIFIIIKTFVYKSNKNIH